MKRLGKLIGGLFALMLAAASMQAMAATQTGKDFNHMSTGFALTGVHATTACETCHIGGVFLGTPRNCDGCHALGSRVVATPKSTAHIITDAACDTCHFNTSTFLGARFNHGTARPGECANCHNGRISTGRAAGHSRNMLMATESCDKCHRTSAWIPASWNHTDTASDCSACHRAAGPGRDLTVGTHLPMSMPPVSFTSNCKGCHSNYYSFFGAFYNHAGAPTTCESCHGPVGTGTTYTGVRAAITTGTQAVHASLGAMGITSCQTCHTSYASFLGARYSHAGASPNCETCHGPAGTGTTYSGVLPATNAMHTNAAALTIITPCSSCHSSTNFTSFAPARYNHSSGAACSTCHDGAHASGGRLLGKSGTHIPDGAAACNTCHLSTTTWTTVTTGATSHATYALAAPNCFTCHSGNTYRTLTGRMRKAPWPGFHESSRNPGATDCSSNGCHLPGGTEPTTGRSAKGVLYQIWD